MSIGGDPVQRRVLALAILALLLVVVWLGPVSMYLDLVGAGSDKLAEKAALLQRYRTLVGAPAANNPQRGPDPSAVMLPAISEEQDVALLQESVKAAAAASHVRVDSLQVLRSETLSGLVKTGVRIRAAGDVAGLGRLLIAIEAARPVLYPDNLKIQPRGAAASKLPEALDFQLDVSAFKRGISS